LLLKLHLIILNEDFLVAVAYVMIILHGLETLGTEKDAFACAVHYVLLVMSFTPVLRELSVS